MECWLLPSADKLLYKTCRSPPHACHSQSMQNGSSPMEPLSTPSLAGRTRTMRDLQDARRLDPPPTSTHAMLGAAQCARRGAVRHGAQCDTQRRARRASRPAVIAGVCCSAHGRMLTSTFAVLVPPLLYSAILDLECPSSEALMSGSKRSMCSGASTKQT